MCVMNHSCVFCRNMCICMCVGICICVGICCSWSNIGLGYRRAALDSFIRVS